MPVNSFTFLFLRPILILNYIQTLDRIAMARVYEPPDSDFDEDFREEYEQKSSSEDEFYAYHPKEKVTKLDDGRSAKPKVTLGRADMTETMSVKPETIYIPPQVRVGLDYLRSQGVPERVITTLTDPNTTPAQCLSILDKIYQAAPKHAVVSMSNNLNIIQRWILDRRELHSTDADKLVSLSRIPPEASAALYYLSVRGIPISLVNALIDADTTPARFVKLKDAIYQIAPRHNLVSVSNSLDSIQKWVIERHELNRAELYPSPEDLGLKSEYAHPQLKSEYKQPAAAESKLMTTSAEVHSGDIYKAFKRLKELGISDNDIDILSDLDTTRLAFHDTLGKIKDIALEGQFYSEIKDLSDSIWIWRREQKNHEETDWLPKQKSKQESKQESKQAAVPAAVQPVTAPPQSTFIGLRRPPALVAPRGLVQELVSLKEIPPLVGSVPCRSKLDMDDHGPPPLLSSSLMPANQNETAVGEPNPAAKPSNLKLDMDDHGPPSLLSSSLMPANLEPDSTKPSNLAGQSKLDHAEILKQVLEKITAVLESHECPIKHDHSKDLVIASDGHIYDRAEITNWVQQKGAQATSPVTRGKITNVFYPAYAAIGAVESLQKIVNFINKAIDPSYVPPEPMLIVNKPPTRETRCEQLEQKSEGSVMIYHYASKRYVKVSFIPSGKTDDLYDLYGHKMQFPEGSFKLAYHNMTVNPGEPMSKYGIERDAVIVHLP